MGDCWANAAGSLHGKYCWTTVGKVLFDYCLEDTIRLLSEGHSWVIVGKIFWVIVGKAVG